ncbi:MAG TPA: hypothetical protein VJM32_02745 [Candidatus Saccharimonadales bacterium]|nr:hypothetical protein [Candidatus Saccharimonadales bacterium]
MDFTYAVLVGHADAKLSGRLRNELAEQGFEVVRCTKPNATYAPELPLSYLMYLDDEKLLGLAKLNVLCLSDLTRVQFAPVWRVLRSDIDTLRKAMSAAHLTFSDLNPAEAALNSAEQWQELGLPTRISHALLRDGICGANMLTALTLEDLDSIRLIGEGAMKLLTALRTRLIEESQQA